MFSQREFIYLSEQKVNTSFFLREFCSYCCNFRRNDWNVHITFLNPIKISKFLILSSILHLFNNKITMESMEHWKLKYIIVVGDIELLIHDKDSINLHNYHYNNGTFKGTRNVYQQNTSPLDVKKFLYIHFFRTHLLTQL